MFANVFFEKRKINKEEGAIKSPYFVYMYVQKETERSNSRSDKIKQRGHTRFGAEAVFARESMLKLQLCLAAPF